MVVNVSAQTQNLLETLCKHEASQTLHVRGSKFSFIYLFFLYKMERAHDASVTPRFLNVSVLVVVWGVGRGGQDVHIQS